MSIFDQTQNPTPGEDELDQAWNDEDNTLPDDDQDDLSTDQE